MLDLTKVFLGRWFLVLPLLFLPTTHGEPGGDHVKNKPVAKARQRFLPLAQSPGPNDAPNWPCKLILSPQTGETQYNATRILLRNADAQQLTPSTIDKLFTSKTLSFDEWFRKNQAQQLDRFIPSLQKELQIARKDFELQIDFKNAPNPPAAMIDAYLERAQQYYADYRSFYKLEGQFKVFREMVALKREIYETIISGSEARRKRLPTLEAQLLKLQKRSPHTYEKFLIMEQWFLSPDPIKKPPRFYSGEFRDFNNFNSLNDFSAIREKHERLEHERKRWLKWQENVTSSYAQYLKDRAELAKVHAALKSAGAQLLVLHDANDDLVGLVPIVAKAAKPEQKVNFVVKRYRSDKTFSSQLNDLEDKSYRAHRGLSCKRRIKALLKAGYTIDLMLDFVLSQVD